MFISCLDGKNPVVKEWFDKVGRYETYKVFVASGYFLPTFSEWNKANALNITQQAEIKELLSNLVPVEAFAVEALEKLSALTNVNPLASAAFFNQTFYFSQAASLGEVAEEAFHAITQTLLSKEERAELINLGEKLFKNRKEEFKQAVENLRRKHPSLSLPEAKAYVIEEEIAKDFVNYFTSGDSSLPQDQRDLIYFENRFKALGSFAKPFAKLALKLYNILSFLIESSKNKEQMKAYFDKIASGFFKNQKIINESENLIPSYRLYRIGTDDLGFPSYLEATKGSMLVQSIAAGAKFAFENNIGLSKEEAVATQIELTRDYYEGKDESIEDLFYIEEELQKLREDVEEQLDSIISLNDVLEEQFDSFEDDFGNETVDYDKEANQKSIDSLSLGLKAYIEATGTILEAIDRDGRNFVILESADSSRIYSGLVRVARNTSNASERLKKIVKFSLLPKNEASLAFIGKLFHELFPKQYNILSPRDSVKQLLEELESSSISTMTEKYNSSLKSKLNLNLVLKGLNLWNRELYLYKYDSKNNLGIAYNSNSQGAVPTQLAYWSSLYNEIKTQDFKEWRDELNFLSRDIRDGAGELNLVINNQNSREAKARALTLTLAHLGVDLSEAFISDYLENKKKTEIKTYNLSVEEEIWKGIDIQVKLNTLIKQINKSEDFPDLFESDVTDASTSKEGFLSLFRQLASGNLYYDETVLDNSFSNYSGETIYNFQWGTYTLKRFSGQVLEAPVVALDDAGAPIYFTEDEDFILSNPLYKNYLSKGIKLESISLDGLKTASLYTTKNGAIRESTESSESSLGLGMSEFSPREFDLARLGLMIRGAKGNKIPVFLGHNEASKLTDFVYIPYTNYLEDGKLTEQGYDAVSNLIQTEYDRISRVRRILTEKFSADKESFSTEELIEADMDAYKDYNTGSLALDASGVLLPKKGLKALQFSPTLSVFDTKDLQKKALEGIPFESLDLTPIIEKGIDSLLASQTKFLQSNGVFPKKKTSYRNTDFILPEEFISGEANVSFNFKKQPVEGNVNPYLVQENLNKMILFYYINSINLNRIRSGDYNLKFKTNISDKPKRARAFNAAGEPLKSDVPLPELGINSPVEKWSYSIIPEPIGKSDLSGGNIDRADAQTLANAEALRKIYYTTNRLNRFTASIFDDMREGKPLSPKKFRDMQRRNAYINVQKTVSGDSTVYHKTSVAPLLVKEFTSFPTEISREEYLDYASEDKYGRTQMIEGATKEVSAFDGKYFAWNPLPSKLDLHEKRLYSEGWRFVVNTPNAFATSPTTGYWIYRGTSHEVDFLAPPTAFKTVQRNVISDLKATDGKKKFYTSYVDAENVMLQTANPAGKVKITNPTQMVEIISNEINGDLDFIKTDASGNVSTVRKTKKQLKEDFSKLLDARNKNQIDIAVKELFDSDGNVVYEYFHQTAIESMRASGTDEQTLKLFEFSSGRLIYNPQNLPLTTEKFKQLYLKHFSNALSHKISGNAMTLISDEGIKVVKKAVLLPGGKDFSWTTVQKKATKEYFDKETKASENDFSNLAFDQRAFEAGGTSELHEAILSKLKAGEDFYYLDGLRHLKRVWNSKGEAIGWSSEAMMPVSDSRQMGKIQDSFRYSFGIRIPSQDKQSGVNIEWVDELPSFMGNSIVVPKEIVEIAGSDFDVDKLFQIRYEGYWTGNEFKLYENTFEDYMEYIFKTKFFKKVLKERMIEHLQDFDVQLLYKFKDKYETTKKRLSYLIDNADDNEDNEDAVAFKTFLKNQISLNKSRLRAALEDIENAENEIKKDILADYSLPFEKEDYTENLVTSAINNEVLDNYRSFLTNQYTLYTGNEQRGVYDTPMDLSMLINVFQDFKLAASEAPADGYVENGFYFPFRTASGESVFEQERIKAPLDSFLSHSLYQEGTVVAKGGIASAVNGNLYAIVAGRFQLKLRKRALIYNGNKLDKFVPLALDGSRVFQAFSTLITATTDEAKEEQLKKHNIKLEDLKVIAIALALGMPLADAVALINAPRVKEYKERIKRYAVKNQEEKDSFKNKYSIQRELISDSTFKKDASLYINSIDLIKDTEDSLKAYINLEDTYEELANIGALIKGKKGFTEGTLHEFDSILEKARKMNLESWLGEEGKEDMNSIIAWNPLEESKEAEEYKRFIELVKDQKEIYSPKIFIETTPRFELLKEALNSFVVAPNNFDYKEKRDKDIATQLIIQELQDLPLSLESLLPQTEDDKRFLNKFLEEKSSSEIALFKKLFAVAGNSKAQRNNESVDALRLTASSKLKPMELDTLRNLFLELYISNPDFAKQLFSYHIVKDGLQFRQGNISKIFPEWMFSEIADKLYSIIENKSINQEETSLQFFSTWYRDVRNKKFLKRINADSRIVKAYRYDTASGKIIIPKEFSYRDVTSFPTEIRILVGDEEDIIEAGFEAEFVGDHFEPIFPPQMLYKGLLYSFNQETGSYIRDIPLGATTISLNPQFGIIPAASEKANLKDLISQLSLNPQYKNLEYYKKLNEGYVAFSSTPLKNNEQNELSENC